MMENVYFVIREKGNVIISIMYCRFNGAYHFVNLTSGHICECAFETVFDAVDDMQSKKDSGEIIDFYEIEV